MHIFYVKMVGGDKPLEDFVLMTVLVKRDATEYVVSHSQFGGYVSLTLFLYSRAVLFRLFLKHTWSQNVICCFCALDGGDDLGLLHVCINHQINF